MLEKYFERSGQDWQIKTSVRRLVRFSPFDLRQNFCSLGRFDLVLCRNVLIYFDVPSRKNILANLADTLFPGGFLLLGSSETTFGLDERYLRRSVGQAVIYSTQLVSFGSKDSDGCVE